MQNISIFVSLLLDEGTSETLRLIGRQNILCFCGISFLSFFWGGGENTLCLSVGHTGKGLSKTIAELVF